jgi:NAD(P)-dependent dehydrogenase (short-subunit alcohol dehydrogenase family)
LTVIQDVSGKVAVVTGSARGIGAAMGKRFAESGMKVVLTDVLEEQLAQTVAELQESGLEVFGFPSDVTSLGSMEALRDRVLERYGAVHLLCNNAGVSSGAQGKMWEHDVNDWRWSVDVNVFGVVHGIKAFVPLMIEQGVDSHVVNTSSGNGGLVTLPAGAIYPTTKAAVVTITECLWAQLKEIGASVGASVLFPSTRSGGLLKTGIWQPGKNRPAKYVRENDPQPDGFDSLSTFLENMDKAGVEVKFASLEEIGELVIEGVRDDKFWISGNDGQGMTAKLQQRLESQLSGTLPSYLLGENMASQSGGTPKK